MGDIVERLRPHWVVLAAATAVTAIGIVVAEPDYTSLQTADGAAAFVRLLDHPGRAIVAVGFDLLFAVAYGLLGWVGLRSHGGGSRLAAWATGAILVGATSDEIENLLVFANIVRRDDLTDGWIDTMQVPGTTKWILVPGFVVLLGFVARAARGRGS